jgi:hypothetical protein
MTAPRAPALGAATGLDSKRIGPLLSHDIHAGRVIVYRDARRAKPRCCSTPLPRGCAHDRPAPPSPTSCASSSPTRPSCPGAELAAYVRLCVAPGHDPPAPARRRGELANLARCTLSEWTACADRILAIGSTGRPGLAAPAPGRRDRARRARGRPARGAQARRAAPASTPTSMADCTQSHAGEPEARGDYLPGFEPELGLRHGPRDGHPPRIRHGRPELSVTDPSRTNTHTHPRGVPVSNGIEHTHTNSRARACVGARARGRARNPFSAAARAPRGGRARPDRRRASAPAGRPGARRARGRGRRCGSASATSDARPSRAGASLTPTPGPWPRSPRCSARRRSSTR